MTHAIVKSVRIAYPDPKLSTTVVRTVGYRAVCGEHFRGTARRIYHEARMDARAHNASAHAQG